MRRMWTVVLAIGSLLTACRRGPDLPVQGRELISLLVDVHVAEAAMQDLYGTTKDSIGQVYYQQVFYMHDINYEIFDSTMAILRRNPEYASRVYARVMRELEEKAAEGQ